MTGADAARDAMQRAAKEAYANAFSAGQAFARAHTPIVRATDLVETMQAVVGFVVAAEHLAAMAAEAEKKARAILAETMTETGCPQVQTDHQLAYLSRKGAYVGVMDKAGIPKEYWVQPPAEPDMKAIKADLVAGKEVAECTLIRPNDQVLNIRSKRRDAA